MDRRKKQHWFFDKIEAGVTYANRPQGATTGAWPGFQPFGGWKGSGASGKNGGGLYYVQLYMHEQIQTLIKHAKVKKASAKKPEEGLQRSRPRKKAVPRKRRAADKVSSPLPRQGEGVFLLSFFQTIEPWSTNSLFAWALSLHLIGIGLLILFAASLSQQHAGFHSISF